LCVPIPAPECFECSRHFTHKEGPLLVTKLVTVKVSCSGSTFFCVREVTSSQFGWDTDYPNRRISNIPSVTTGTFLNRTSNYRFRFTLSYKKKIVNKYLENVAKFSYLGAEIFTPLVASGSDFLLLVRRTLSSGAEIFVLLRSSVLFVRILFSFCRFKVRYFHTFRVLITNTTNEMQLYRFQIIHDTSRKRHW
jgi:hypothetical protein